MTTPAQAPDAWTDAMAVADLGDRAVGLELGDPITRVMIVRDAGEVLALHDQCPHRGCILNDGPICEGVVECTCHGSRLDLRTGAVVRGPAALPVDVFESRTCGDRIEVRLTPS